MDAIERNQRLDRLRLQRRRLEAKRQMLYIKKLGIEQEMMEVDQEIHDVSVRMADTVNFNKLYRTSERLQAVR